MRNYCLLILIIVVLPCCTTSLFDEINTSNIVPAGSELKIVNFEKEHSIRLDWEEDPGADEYILYRDENPYGSFSSIIYQGKELFYEDTKIIDDLFYYYKLAKKRELKCFDPSEFVVGCGGDIRVDDFEENDLRSTAAGFQNKTSANIYYFKDQYGNVLEDQDWYAVRIEARIKLTIVVKNCQNFVNGDLYYNEQGGVLQPIHNGVEFSISNNAYTSVVKYFQISVNTSQFLGSPSATGGKFATYDVCFVLSENIS